MNEDDEALRFRAATALGRVGDLAAVPGLIDRLSDKDLSRTFAIFTALNRIGRANSAAWSRSWRRSAASKRKCAKVLPSRCANV